jgi:hypothetical protein
MASTAEISAHNDNIKVFCRVRPLASSGARKSVTAVEDATRVIVGNKHQFSFDWIADGSASQDQVFEAIGKPLAQSFLDGYVVLYFSPTDELLVA